MLAVFEDTRACTIVLTFSVSKQYSRKYDILNSKTIRVIELTIHRRLYKLRYKILLARINRFIMFPEINQFRIFLETKPTRHFSTNRLKMYFRHSNNYLLTRYFTSAHAGLFPFAALTPVRSGSLFAPSSRRELFVGPSSCLRLLADRTPPPPPPPFHSTSPRSP